jgi:hypothetical protein
MAYAFQMDVPIGADVYHRIREGLGNEVPEGLIVHMAVERDGGKLRYFMVWESEDAWERFSDERLHPVVDRIFKEAGMNGRVEEPEQVPLTVHDVWGSMQARELMTS